MASKNGVEGEVAAKFDVSPNGVSRNGAAQTASGLSVAANNGLATGEKAGANGSAPADGSTPGGLGRAVAKIKSKTGLEPAPSSIPATEITRQIWPELKSTPLGRALRAVMDDEVRRTDCDFPNIMVVAALQKTRDEKFVIPMEGKYVGSIETHDIGQTYSSQYNAQET